jgi:hypothetical protein
VIEEPDDVIARIADDIQRVQQRAEALPKLQAAVDAVRETARGDRRDLLVEVDASGRLTRLEIDDDAVADRGGRAVSAEILGLIEKATRGARAKTLAATEQLLGAGDPIAAKLQSDAEAQDAASAARARGWTEGGAR